MYKKICCALILFPLFVSVSLAAEIPSQVKDIIFITEENPPSNFTHDNKLIGIAPDLLELIWKEIGQGELTVDVQPWARGYFHLQDTPGTCLFSTTKTEEREALGIKWAGPIKSNNIVLMARKDSNIKVENIEDLKKLIIGTIIADIGEQLVLGTGVEEGDLSRVSSLKSAVGMLRLGRVDVVAKGHGNLIGEIKELGDNVDDYEVVFTLKSSYQYFAFHKDTPDDLVKIFQTAIDNVKEEHRAIIESYQ